MACVLGLLVGALVGLVGLGTVVFYLPAKARFARRAVSAPGVVVSSEVARVRESGGKTFDIRVRFTAADGRTAEFTASTVEPLRAEPGARVPVLYDPADPARADLAFSRSSLAVGYVVAIVAALGGAAAVVLVAARMLAGEC